MSIIDPLTGRLVQDPAAQSARPAPGGARLLDLDDALLFAPRAAEGLARSVVGLVDVLPGVDTGIAERRSFLGRSDTLIGGALEGLTQVLVPYGGFSKGLRAVSFLTRAERLAAAGGAASKAGRFARVAERIGREALAGAGADFVAFSGTEGRLSDVLNQAGLGNAVTEFLGSDPDDSEIVGRFKGALEGAGIGVAADAVTSVLSALKVGRKVAATGATPEQVEAAVQEQLAKGGSSDKVRDFLRAVDRGANVHARTIKEARRANPDAGEVILEATEATGARRADQGESLKRAKAKLGALTIMEAVERGVDPAKLLVGRTDLSEERIKFVLARYQGLVRANAGDIADRLGGDPTKLTKEQQALVGLSEDGMNLSGFLEDDEDTIALIRALEGELAKRQLPLRTGKQTEDQMILAGLSGARDILQLDPDDLAPFAARFIDDTRRVGTLSIALQIVMGSSANRALTIVRYLRGEAVDPDRLKELGVAGLTPDQALEAAMTDIRRLSVFRDARALGGSNLGRSLRSLGVPTSSGLLRAFRDLGDVRSVQSLRSMLGDEEFARRLEMVASVSNLPSLNRTAALSRLADATTGEKILAVSTEWFINSLLSSPRTITTNFLFPLVTSLYVPLEHMIGGSVQYLMTGGAHGADTIARSARTLVGMTMAVGEASTVGMRALKEGPILRATQTKRDDAGELVNLISSESFGQLFGKRWGPEAPFAALIDGIGKLSRMPTRLMSAADDFNKTMAARGLSYARLTEEALAKGMDPAEFVPEALDNMFIKGQAVTDEYVIRRAHEIAPKTGDPVSDGLAVRDTVKRLREELRFDELNPVTTEALARADEVTATTPLEPGTYGYKYQNFVNSIPALRLITPFIRTPVNLVKFAGQRTDVLSAPNILFRRLTHDGLENAEASRLRNVRDLLSGDPRRQAEAYGRQVTGIGALATFISLANAGHLTGNGPEDPERRQLLTAAGWLPYSVKVGNGYVQYLRADPFAISLGMAADLVEIARFRYNEDQDMIDAALVSTWMAVMNNIVNRTYMAGIRNLVDATSRGERFAESAIAGFAAGFTIPRLFQAAAAVNDPVIRDAAGIIERLRARTPFLSEGVPPLRDMLGDPMDRVMSLGADPESMPSRWLDMIVPIAYREVKDDQIRTELASLNHGFAPPRQIVNGVDLAQERREDGRTAYDRWQELHKEVKVGGRTLAQELRRVFKTQAYKALPRESTPSVESPRVRIVRNAVARYRAEAWERTLTEFPMLSRKLAEVKRDQARARAGLRTLNPLPEVPEPFRQFVQ